MNQPPATSHQPSQTLTNLVKRLDAIAFARSEADYADIAAIRSALVAREMLGFKRYGKTLDDQPAADYKLWLRMSLEEVLDAMMYIQKASQCDYPTGQHPAGSLVKLLAEVVDKLLQVAMPEALRELADQMIRPDLFPPVQGFEKADKPS